MKVIIHKKIMVNKRSFVAANCFQDKKPIWCKDCKLYIGGCTHVNLPKGRVIEIVSEED